MKLFRFLPVIAFAAGLYGQTPVVTSVQNPASNTLPGLPNYGMAQGQIIVIYGTNLGPTTLAQATALPWPNTVGGTSVKITQQGTAYNLPIIYSLNTQVAAIVPSNVPLGAGALVQVTYNGTASFAYNTRILDTNFGISTVDTSGTGTAVITDANYKVITAANSAKTGSTYAMWGTGLGAANSDNNIATNGDLGTPLQVFVGGVQAIVTYRGRSGAPGLDQINFTIPQGVSGCYVSLSVVTTSATTGSRVSNSPTIPVTANGGACSDSNNFNFTTINAALAARNKVALAGVTFDKTDFRAFFLSFSPAQVSGLNGFIASVSPGSCATTVLANASAQGGSDGVPASTGLNAGTALTLTTPAGASFTAPQLLPGAYAVTVGVPTAGTYKLSNGNGGADIGPFNVSFSGPASFSWTNSSVTAVPRNTPLTVTWTTGDPNGFVEIVGQAIGNPITVNGQTVPTNTGVYFVCEAPSGPGSFTIPSSALLAMPPVTGGVVNGTLSLQQKSALQILTIPNTDLGVTQMTSSQITSNVSYQ